MIKLGNCPYYNIEVFNIIKMAVDQGRHISSLKCKEWYTFLLNYELFESSPDGKLDLVPYRVQLQQPQWKLLHQLLPTKERQTRILRGGNDSLCTSCDMGEVDNLLDTLTACPNSRETFHCRDGCARRPNDGLFVHFAKRRLSEGWTHSISMRELGLKLSRKQLSYLKRNVGRGR